jgi:hypothetical protein
VCGLKFPAIAAKFSSLQATFSGRGRPHAACLPIHIQISIKSTGWPGVAIQWRN